MPQRRGSPAPTYTFGSYTFGPDESGNASPHRTSPHGSPHRGEPQSKEELDAHPLGGASTSDSPNKAARLSSVAAPLQVAAERAKALKGVVHFCFVPARLVLETLQIISSFKKTMHLTWPNVYVVLIRRLSFLNLNLLTLPGTACSTPRSDFYNSFNGITISVAGMLCYMGLVWRFGVWRMRRLGWAQESIAAFNRKTLSRLITFLTISYAPVTEVVLSMYSCRSIAGVLYLREDTSKSCLYDKDLLYRRLAGFWVAFYVFGVPLLYLGLLVYYNIPTISRELQNNVKLRNLWSHAHHRGVQLPEVHVHSITTKSIKDEHVAMLYKGILKNGDATLVDRLRRCLPGREPGREEQLRELLGYSSLHLHHAHVTWHEAAKDPRMAGAYDSIGLLYREFYADTWYWILFESCNKLVITGVLGFISPGTEGQVAAGMLITFISLLLYQRALPYSEKVYRQIGYGAAIQLFVFLVFALLLSAKVPINGHDTAADTRFYGACLGVLTSSVFTLPVVLIIHRLFVASVEEEEGEEEEVAADYELLPEPGRENGDAYRMHSNELFTPGGAQ